MTIGAISKEKSNLVCERGDEKNLMAASIAGMRQGKRSMDVKGKAAI
jgi:hypothetical protein